MPEQIFYPYKFHEHALAVSATSARLNGGPIEIARIADGDKRVIDLIANKDWESCDLEFEIRLEGTDLSDALKADEDRSAVDVHLTLSCPATRLRVGTLCVIDPSTRIWTGTLSIVRDKCMGFSVIQAVAVRKVDVEEPVRGLAGRAGERIADSKEWRIYSDDRVQLPGGDIDIKWQKFSESSRLKPFATCLYYTDLADDEKPRVLLNEEIVDLKATLMNPQKRGKGAHVRDGLQAGMIQQVLTDLAVFAVRTGPVAPDELKGWRKDVLATLAGYMYPDRTNDDAIAKAYGAGRDEGSLHEFLALTSVAVQKHIDFDRTSSNLIKLVEGVAS